MDFTVTISGSPSTVTLTSDGTAVTILDHGPQVTVQPLVSQPVVNPDGSRIVELQTGPPGQNATITILTLAEYLALSPEQQTNGTWYVVPAS